MQAIRSWKRDSQGTTPWMIWDPKFSSLRPYQAWSLTRTLWVKMLTWARRMNYSAGLQIGNQSPKDGIKKFRITKETGTFLLSNHSSSRLWRLLHLSLDLAFKPQEITGELEAKLIWWHRKLGQSWMKTLSMDSNCRSQGHSSPKGSSLTQVSQGITNLWLPYQ